MKDTLFRLWIFFLMTAIHGFANQTKTEEWGPATNGLQMFIQLKSKQKELKTNQPVEMLFRVKNVSTNETYMISRDRGTYSFVVVSPSGKNKSPNRTPRPYFGSVDFVGPNKTAEFEFDLSRLCEFDEIGTYKIIAKRAVSRLGKNAKAASPFEVVSNPLHLSVVPEGENTHNASELKR